jgi:ubiquinone/menaquinone biosynthesis C-methylase UbiE
MDKEYFKQYYHLERAHWWFVGRMEILNQMLELKIKNQNPLKILNVGVATGLSSKMLEGHGDVTSVEYDEDCCAFLKDQGFEVTQASMTDLPFEDESFDLVCAFDVIEHIKDDNAALAEAKRVLKKGGYVFITVPMYMALWSDHDIINHHERRYENLEINSLITHHFDFQYSTFFNSILLPPIWFVRKLSNVFKSKNRAIKSDFENFKTGMVNNLLLMTLRMEKRWLKFSRLGFGVSYLVIAKKK